jgi:hypothetical protein
MTNRNRALVELEAKGIKIEEVSFTHSERLIVAMIDRLFWLTTQIPGVARYASDVELFTEVAIAAGVADPEQARKLASGYRKSEEKG